MIDIPNLNSLGFKEIFENTTHYIKNFSSSNKEMIDISYQDPLQTLIELFALLTDMQGFYMDYIGEEHYLKYIKLLGYELDEAISATTYIEIRETTKWRYLPYNLPFYSENLIPYESKYFTKISRNLLVSIITFSGNGGSKKMKSTNYVFQNITKEEAEIYIGFQESFNVQPVEKIFIQVVDQNIPDNFIPLGSIKIEAFAMGYDRNADWTEINIVDHTNCFMHSGFIEIDSNIFMVKRKIGDSASLYWLRLTIKESYFEIPPIIKDIKINILEAKQTKTYCATETIITNTNKPLLLKHYLAIYGEFEIYRITENEQYIPVKYNKTEYLNEGYIECTLKDFYSNNCKLAIVYYDNEFCHRVYTSTGLPNQKIQLDIENVDEKSLKILVYYEKEQNGYWKLWKRVDSLSYSLPDDLHFIVKDNSIVFGNHEQGNIAIGDIKIISCQSSIFEKGNIREGQINKCILDCKPNNIIDAFGGRAKQRIKDILNKLPKNLEKITRAVTIQNYVDILKTIPYLPLSHIKVYIENEKANVINILVRPKSIQKLPHLNKLYKQNILNYLDSYCLLTTELVISGPEYIGVDVSIDIEFNVGFASCEEKTIDTLSKYFPYKGFDDIVRLDFGETISENMIYKLLYNMPWVLSVKNIKINNSKDIPLKDIPIERYHLVYINEIKINIVGA